MIAYIHANFQSVVGFLVCRFARHCLAFFQEAIDRIYFSFKKNSTYVLRESISLRGFHQVMGYVEC